MSDLTEVEIIDCMKTSLKSAANHCRQLAKLANGELPNQGSTYDALREDFKLIEGCCQQLTHWRENYKWNVFSAKIVELRGWSLKFLDGTAKSCKKFLDLANLFDLFLTIAEDLERRAHGARGPILPALLPDPNVRHRPVQVLTTPRGELVTQGGIILPPSFAGVVT